MDRDRLEEAKRRFLRRCDAESTKVAYGRELKRFLKWLPEETGLDLLLDYRDHLRGRNLGKTTVRWRLTVVRAYIEFAQEHRYWDEPTDLSIKLPKGQRGFAPRILTRSELNRLLSAPDRRIWNGARDAAILTCLGLGGLRACEVCGLRLDDLNGDRVGIELRVRGKGAKMRKVPLPSSGRGIIEAWLRRRRRSSFDSGLLFVRSDGGAGRSMDTHAVRYVVRKHAARAGLKQVSSHALRHTAASLAIDAGEPLHRLRDRLGHSSVLVTSRYLHAR